MEGTLHTRLSNKALTIITITMLSVASILTVLAVASLAPKPCPATSQKYFFTIVSTLSGFNDSKNHPDQPWPIMAWSRDQARMLKSTSWQTEQESSKSPVQFHARFIRQC